MISCCIDGISGRINVDAMLCVSLCITRAACLGVMQCGPGKIQYDNYDPGYDPVITK